MFDLGWSKVLILAAVAIVVVGPKELPGLLRTLGQFVAQLRRHAAEFRTQFDDAMRSTELDQIRRDVAAIKTDTTASLRGIERSIQDDTSATRESVEKSFALADGSIAIEAPVAAAASTPAEPMPPVIADVSPPASPPAPTAVPTPATLETAAIANDAGTLRPAKTGS